MRSFTTKAMVQAPAAPALARTVLWLVRSGHIRRPDIICKLKKPRSQWKTEAATLSAKARQQKARKWGEISGGNPWK